MIGITIIRISHHFEFLSKTQLGIPSGIFVGFWAIDGGAIIESVEDTAVMVVGHSSMVKLFSVVVDSLIADVSFVVES